ncbi:hypothetical protein ABEG17_09965 [Pedococcus sp. KACC 23699]|uniref:Uncharacterized protein n=1 Tax=Pedococcus sp. KACC 23699 TaxID=3149228 RepID=A0AAU7JNT1_9MICO
MSGPTMTPDDMDPTPLPADGALDASADDVLGGAQASGDAALDSALDTLRTLSTLPAPTPTGELAALLAGSTGASGVSDSSGASGGSGGDEVGRRRQGHARHVATGTTAVAGILLLTATAAAAIGTLHGERLPARHTLPPAVMVPSTPHPAGTTPTQLPPVVPALSTASSGEGLTKNSRAGGSDQSPSLHGARAMRSTSASHGSDEGDDTASTEPRDGRDDGQTPAHATVTSRDDDSAPSTSGDDGKSTTGPTTGDDDHEDEATSTGSGGGSDDGSDDSSRGGSGGEGDSDSGPHDSTPQATPAG